MTAAAKAPRWWQRYLDWRQRNVVRLESDDTGFSIIGYRLRVEGHWCDVTRATAFKRDLLTRDLLCVLLETGEGLVEVDEEMQRYPALEAQMLKALGIGDDWKAQVLFPAFAPNATVIFDRGAPHA